MRRLPAGRNLKIVGGSIVATLALVFGLPAVVDAATSSTSVTCTQTATTLSCPLPRPTATVTSTVTATTTVTASPSAPVTTPPASSTPPASGFPSAATTGVPAGTVLRTVPGGYTVNSGTAAGLNVQGDLIVGPGVTVTTSRVTGSIRSTSGDLSNVKITDTDVGLDACPASQSGNDPELLVGTFTLLRVHAHNWDQDLLRLVGGTGSVTDSLINGTCYYANDHLDAAQFYDPGSIGHWTFEHDRIDAAPKNTKTGERGNTAILWTDHPAASSTLTVADSYLSGGNFTVVTDDGGTVSITNNTFEKGSAQYGYCSATGISPHYSGNVDTAGSPVC